MQSNRSAFITLVSVFFFWGFVAASNGILIPLFKDKFTLTQFQSQLIDFAFYASYFVGSLIIFLMSLFGKDPIQKMGYKTALIAGLLISAAGSLIFIPAAKTESYTLFMVALFTIGLGFALQQIVANPFVINFGDVKTGAHRLNLAGGINSFGTTIGPVLLSYALYKNISGLDAKSADLNAVIAPALILFSLFLVCALVLKLNKLPDVGSAEVMEKELGAFRYPQLTFGMLAIFIYVGVEVSIQSNMGALLAMPEIKGIDHTKISSYISLYWGSLMIGRWTGALEVFNFKNKLKHVMIMIVPIVAFFIIYGINYLRGSDVSDYFYYLPFVIIASGLFILSGSSAAKSLITLSLAAIVMMCVGLITSGNIALFSFMSGGLFCSVMWPCIFALAINGLGKFTNQGSSLLIMMILGGAIIPPIQGFLVDTLNAQSSYLVAIICFAYLAWYGFAVNGFYKKQGISSEGDLKNSH
jgi:MFS transporter, FHS family, L-fucose permease